MDTATSSTFLVPQHLTYLALSLATTLWVGRTLFKNGAAFLSETFLGKELLAESVNKLLLVGYYLVNGGWVLNTLKNDWAPRTMAELITNVASSYGTVLLILGGMHFGNLYVLSRMRRRAIAERSGAPISPETFFRPSEA